MHPYIAVPATLVLILRAWSNNSLTPAGLVVGALTAVVHALHPWNAFFALLVVFFLGGSTVSKVSLGIIKVAFTWMLTASQVKHDVKQRLTQSSTGASGGEGARTHIQVLANSAVASALILLHYRQLLFRDKSGNASQGCWPYGEDILVVGIVSNYAAVAADTFSSELGILSKSKPRLITSWNLRQVPPGTNGGVTIVGTLAGLLGAFLIALTSALLLPFCSVGLTSRTGRLFGENQPGLDGGSGWGLREKGLWIVAVTLWGGLGSILDSFLGGWLQSSVVDARTGKVIEGIGGKKVPVLSQHAKKENGTPSRKVLSGIGLLDNNGVNYLMALMMSFGGIVVASYIWHLPLTSILS